MKREKILEAGFKLFKQKGYYKTNTAEIAKEAGVSTGIVYRYFTDKKAIFIESMEQFFHEVYNIFIDNIKTINSSSELPEYLNSTIDYAISISDITIFIDLFPKLGLSPVHSHEKLHVILELINSYCDEFLFHQEKCKDYNYLRELIINTCINILNE